MSASSELYFKLPHLDVWQGEDKPLENLALKSFGIWSPEFPRTGRNRNSILGWSRVGLLCTRTQGKQQWHHKRLGQTYLVVLEDLLKKQGGNCGSLQRQGHWQQWNWGVLIDIRPYGGCHFLTKTWLTQQHVGSSAGMPQVKQPTGWENSLIYEKTGCLKSSWVHSCPVSTSPDLVLPTRGTRLSCTHQWAGMNPSHKEAFTSFLDSFIYQW